MLAPTQRSEDPSSDMHRQDMSTLSDLELLQIEMDLLWGTEPGPSSSSPAREMECARGSANVFRRNLPGPWPRRSTAHRRWWNRDTPPPQLERWRMLLETHSLPPPGSRLAPAPAM